MLANRGASCRARDDRGASWLAADGGEAVLGEQAQVGRVGLAVEQIRAAAANQLPGTRSEYFQCPFQNRAVLWARKSTSCESEAVGLEPEAHRAVACRADRRCAPARPARATSRPIRVRWPARRTSACGSRSWTPACSGCGRNRGCARAGRRRGRRPGARRRAGDGETRRLDSNGCTWGNSSGPGMSARALKRAISSSRIARLRLIWACGDDVERVVALGAREQRREADAQRVARTELRDDAGERLHAVRRRR